MGNQEINTWTTIVLVTHSPTEVAKQTFGSDVYVNFYVCQHTHDIGENPGVGHSKKKK